MLPNTNILSTNCIFNYQTEATDSPIPKVDYKNKVNFSVKDTLSVDGERKSNNKYAKPYIHNMLAYLFTGKNEYRMDNCLKNLNIPETTSHFGLVLDEYELNDIFRNVDNLLNQQIKDDRPSQLYGLFQKVNIYSIEIILRQKNEDLIVINIYEFEVSSIVKRFVFDIRWYDWTPKNKSFDFELYGKCRYCVNRILFLNNVLQLYYCPKHGYIDRQSYIMYEAKVASSKETYSIRVPSIISSLSECPFLDQGYCLFGIRCIYPHSEIEKRIRHFISEEKINLQILASEEQRQTNQGNQQHISGELFKRNIALHDIVKDDNMDRFKEFLLYSDYDILEECNEDNENILHVVTKNDQLSFMELLLDPRRLYELFESKDLPSCVYSKFVNKSAKGQTALDILLDRLKNETDESNKKRSIERLYLFIECEDCDLDNVLLYAQQNKLEKLEELIRRRQYEREIDCN